MADKVTNITINFKASPEDAARITLAMSLIGESNRSKFIRDAIIGRVDEVIAIDRMLRDMAAKEGDEDVGLEIGDAIIED